MNKKFFGAILFFLGIDWITKYLFYDLKLGAETWLLTPYLNTGIAWSFPVPQWIVFVLGIGLVGGVLFFWLKHTSSDSRAAYFFPLVFFVAGAVGNLLDRVFYGGVRDFVDLQVWPIFNVADVLLTLTVVFLLRVELRGVSFRKKSD